MALVISKVDGLRYDDRIPRYVRMGIGAGSQYLDRITKRVYDAAQLDALAVALRDAGGYGLSPVEWDDLNGVVPPELDALLELPWGDDTVELPNGLAYFAANGSSQGWYGQATQPNALYDATSGKTFIAWHTYDISSNTRYTHIRFYHHASKVWGPVHSVGRRVNVADDDHAVPALAMNADGRLVVWWGGHNTDLYMAVSQNVRDLTRWTGYTIAGTYTYPHPVARADGSIDLFIREKVNPGAEFAAGAYPLVYRKITFSGATATVGASVRVGSMGNNSRFYMGDTILRQDGLVHQIACRADYDDNYRRHVYYIKHDTAAATATNLAGTQTIAWPLTQTDLDTHFRLYQHATDVTGNIPALAFDSNGRGHVTYNIGGMSDGGGSELSPQTVYHAIIAGGAMSTGVQIGALDQRYEAFRLVPESDGRMGVYYPTLEAVRGGDIARRILPAGGSSMQWGPAQIVGQWNRDRDTLNQSSTVHAAHPDLRVLWCEGGTADWDHRLFAHGDAGLVRRARPNQPALPAGLAGAWDASTLGTLWQDLNGTLPATQPGDPVRRIDDRAGTNHLLLDAASTVPGLLYFDDDTPFVMIGRPDGTSLCRFITAASFGLAAAAEFWIGGAGRASNLTNLSSLVSYDGGTGQPRVMSLVLGPSFVQSTTFSGTTGTTMAAAAGTNMEANDAVLSFERAGGVNKLFMDEVEVATQTVAMNTTPLPKLAVGANQSGSNIMTGRFYALIARSGAPTSRALDLAFLRSRVPNR